jgi:phosphate transport system permease protein
MSTANGSTATRRIYICRAADGRPHLPTRDTYPSLQSAAAAVGQQAQAGGAAPAGQLPERWEIAFLDDPAKPQTKLWPKYRFYFDTHSAGLSGDGSERDPWPDVRTALASIEGLYREGQLSTRSGEGILLERREIFTATAHERRKQRTEWIARLVFCCMAFSLVIPLIAILSYLVYQAWPALSWEFLTVNPRDAMTAGGIWAPLVGTFFLVLFSLLIAAPIGVLAGVYLNEYARDNWLTRVINLAVVNLAGVPSIVHALFGVGAFVVAAGMGQSLVAASCTLAVMTLPVIITSTREALAAVPMAFREACWNMGASRWQTIRTIVLPNSISGILTGVILQVARSAGETAPILFTGATLYMRVADTGLASFFPYEPWDKVMALSYHLYVLMTQVNNATPSIVYGTAVVLIGLVLMVNSLAILLRTILRSRKKW